MADEAYTKTVQHGDYVTIRTYWRGKCVTVWTGLLSAWSTDG